MKNYLFIAAAACVALAACTKNEVKPVEVEPEITYQTISTKAGTAAMNAANHFISYAYFLEKGNNWDSNSSSAKAYISAAEISFQTDCWKAAKSYYWPKQGGLTFFAWSANNATPTTSVTPAPTCSTSNGIEVSSYDITANKDVDFLVADIVKNQTANTSTVGSWKAGVPTVFKHALSKLVFKVVTVKGSTEHNYTPDNVTFTVKSIKLKGVNNKLSYSQGWQSGSTASKHTWTDPASPVEIDVPVFTGSYVATNSATALTPSETDYYIVIPQGFDADDVLEIVYEIKTEFITGKPVIETVTISDKKLSDIYTANWEPGKEYTLTIKLGIDEVLWAPTVEEWADGTTVDVTI